MSILFKQRLSWRDRLTVDATVYPLEDVQISFQKLKKKFIFLQWKIQQRVIRQLVTRGQLA